MTDTPKTPGQALDAALSTLATKDDLRQLRAETKDDLRQLRAEVSAEASTNVDRILAAINGGIEQLRADLNAEFAKHKIPVKLATKR